MADVPATKSQILQIFKEVYGDRVQAQANKKATIYQIFQKSKREQSFGKYWAYPVLKEAGSGAVGSRAENVQLADAQSEEPLQTQVAPKYHYATIQVTGPAMAQSRNKQIAFIQAKDLEVKEKTASLIADLNRQCYNDSHGELGDVASDGANTITFGTEVNMNWFRVGMKIDIFDVTLATKRNGTTGTPAEGRTVTVVNKSTRTITYSGTDLAAGIVATDRVFKEDIRLSFAAGDEGAEMAGLRFIIDDGTDSNAIFQNISGSTVAIWRGQRLFNSGTLRPLSLDLLQSAADTSFVESGQEVDFIISGLGQRRMYVNLLWHDARYEPQDFKGGFRILQFAAGGQSMPWMVDKDCMPQQVIQLWRESIRIFESQPVGILDEMGVAATRQSKKDTYEVLLGGYFNLGIDNRRNANVRLGDLQEP